MMPGWVWKTPRNEEDVARDVRMGKVISSGNNGLGRGGH